MEKEIWKPVVGYEGKYEVSSFGRVRSIDFYRKSGNSGYIQKGRILKYGLNSSGYRHVSIGASERLHKLVAISFIPNPDNKPCINHKNGIKTDNRIENLEWCTYSQNSKHAWDTGLCDNHPFRTNPVHKGKIGKLSKYSKIVLQYDLEMNLTKQWWSVMDIERELGIRSGRISACCLGKYGYKTAGGFIWKYKNKTT